MDAVGDTRVDAVVDAESPIDQHQHGRLRRLAPGAGLVVLVLAVVCAVLALEPVRIGSNSMAPTLTAGERVLVDKVSLHFREPRRGEIVAFYAPDNRDLTIKRVAAVAGDRIAIANGVLSVDGRRIHEDYVDHNLVKGEYFGPETVPIGTVFVLGDNRDDSIDSRSYGPVLTDDVVGRVLGID